MLTPDVQDTIVRIASADVRIRAIYLFGSRATGESRADSDVDLGVYFASQPPIEDLLALEDSLATALGREVDLVDVARATAFLALEIVRGERLFCRDEDEVDRFELYVLRRAGDLLPFERERQRMLIDARMDGHPDRVRDTE